VAISDWLTWEIAKEFAHSNIVTSFIGALAGAGGGAWAAQRIADRAKVRQQLLEEVRNTNAAVEQAYSVAMTCLNLKEQHIRDLWWRYRAQKAVVHAHDRGVRDGTIATPLNIGGLDLQGIGEVPVSSRRLEETVTGKLSIAGRPRSLVAVLCQSINTLNEVIKSRNALVTAYRASNAPIDQKVAEVFGLPRDGIIDETFGTNVQALYKGTDDCIHFSKLLCTDLTVHGRVMRKEFLRRFRGEIPHVTEVIWDDIEKRDLLPSPGDYLNWETGFLRPAHRSYGRHRAKVWYWTRKVFRRSPAGQALAGMRRWRMLHRGSANGVRRASSLRGLRPLGR